MPWRIVGERDVARLGRIVSTERGDTAHFWRFAQAFALEGREAVWRMGGMRVTFVPFTRQILIERVFTDTSPERVSLKESELRGRGYRLVTKDIGQRPGRMEYTKTVALSSEDGLTRQTTLQWIE